VLSVGDASIVEGNTGVASAHLPVSLSAPSPQPVSVTWATRDGSAQAGSDYLPAGGTLIFPAGVTSGSVNVSVVGDTAVEPDETLSVELSQPIGVTLAKATGTVTIIDDDRQAATGVPPTLSISDTELPEDNSGTAEAAFAVTLSRQGQQTISVDYRTSDGTATAGSDYQPASGTLSFSPGETTKQIRVKVNGDTTVEPDETFTVELSNPAKATIARATATGTIRNDDQPVAPPAALPDLIVVSIDGLTTPGENFSSCQVSFTIKNSGTGTAGASTAQVRAPTGISTVAVAAAPTPALAPGQSDHEQATLAVDCSVVAVTVTADVNNTVTESNETNNTLSGPSGRSSGLRDEHGRPERIVLRGRRWLDLQERDR
jgi:hypothetical protein